MLGATRTSDEGVTANEDAKRELEGCEATMTDSRPGITVVAYM